VRGNDSATGEPGPRDRERRGAWAKKLVPTGLPQRAESERGSAREGELPLIGGSHLSGGAGARPGWAEFVRLGCISFLFFLGFSNSYSISFL
jgi:hypothetical protein